MDKKEKRSDASSSGRERMPENLVYKSKRELGKKSKSTVSDFWKLTNKLQLADECFSDYCSFLVLPLNEHWGNIAIKRSAFEFFKSSFRNDLYKMMKVFLSFPVLHWMNLWNASPPRYVPSRSLCVPMCVLSPQITFDILLHSTKIMLQLGFYKLFLLRAHWGQVR